MIKDIQELNFPEYATLSSATCSLPDMGEKSITSTVRIDGRIAPDFSFDWEVVFKGEKYIMPLRTPQGSKDNETMLSSNDLTFQHWAIYQLKRRFFFNIVNLEAGTTVPDEYDYPITLNLGDFCILFGKVLDYYFGGKITIDLNPEWEYATEPQTVTISHSKIWNVLVESFYDVYGVRWQIAPRLDNDNETKDGERYVIKVGYPTTEVDHIFEYGFEGGLLKVERQVQSENISNMIIGRGGEKNLPYRYFKQHDEDNASFSPDPDWVPELKDRYFANLHGATFRSYIQGWNHRHYKRTSITSASQAYSPWAWMRGYTDLVFHPVEYVADEFTTEDSGYGVKIDSSIAKYGEIEDGLDNNDDIYPTIQGVIIPPYGRIDQVVDVEPITSDEIKESAESDAVKLDASSCKGTVARVIPASYETWWVQGNGTFRVSEGKIANLVVSLEVLAVNENGVRLNVADNAEIEAGSEIVRVFNMVTGEEHSASAIPEGEWGYQVSCRVHNMTTDKILNITVGSNDVHIVESTPSDKWGDTWDIWVKNIWQTEKLADETDTEYAERVWKPILGDREGGEAKVVFSSGWLSTSEDYEFIIAKTPVFDTTKSIGGVQSHWRITLGKSDADLESLGLYVPSTKRQANAGDYFFFIGIDMPHLYVVEAEKRLDDWKKDELAKIKDIKPTWVVTLDKVRIHNYGNPGAIIDSLHPGDTFTLRDERFIPGSHQEKLYLTSITYTYTEPTDKEANLLPDVEVVLSDDYTVSANPVSLLQGEVSALQKQIGSISNIEQVVRAVSDKLYLRKDGFSDRSYSPTEFASLLTSAGFRSGIAGGQGWGFFKDENGNWVLETDRINVRQDMTVNNLIINQIEGRGGMIVESAARMEITEVVKSQDGYVCYFDQKEGTIANLFHLGDVAWCNRFTPDNNDLKFYKRRVMGVTENSVTLSDVYKNGDGIPSQGDVIVHYGSYTDKTRQYVKVRDVIGGGYERYIEGLDSVDADGVEYYYVGRQDGQGPRWFIGDHDGEYAEYKDKKLTLRCALSIESTIDGKTLINFIKENGGLNDDVKDFVSSALQGIQDQIDGVIETWFYNGEPTLSNYPAVEWITDSDKEKHLSDLYFDNKTGLAYRFSKDVNGNYFWNDKVDSATAKALADAARAQDTADGKRRVFTSQPLPPYDPGDLWANATYPFDGSLFKDDLLRCFTPKVKGETFSISDWDLATKYTDDTKAEEAIARIEKLDYIKDALKDFTTINGGLVLSSLISLGVNNADFTTQATWSGISGLYKPDKTGGGIAAWYGGDMLDKADYYNWDESLQRWVIKPNTSVAGLRIAQGLDRMDGTGYRAGGSIWWDASGNIHADPLSFFVGEESVGNVLGLFKFHPTNNTAFAQTTAVTPQRVFTKLRIGSDDGTKSVTLSYDAANNALKIDGNAYTTGDLAALGTGSLSIGGGTQGGGSAYDRLDAWGDYSSDKSGYVLSAALGYGLKTEIDSLKSGAPLSLSVTGNGNAITDISKSGNTITATKGTTFLTQQSLANLVTLDTTQVISGGKQTTSYISLVGSNKLANGINRFSSGVLSFRETSYDDNFGIWADFSGSGSSQNLYIGGGGSGANIEYTQAGDNFTPYLTINHTTGNLKVKGSISREGGTSSQFLKADGSVDGNAYFLRYNTSNDNIDIDWGQSVKTFDPVPSGTPPERCANITLLSLGNDFDRKKMLAFPYNNDNIYYRRRVNGVFKDWVMLLHSGNYSTYALPRSGGTMTGALNFANSTANIMGDDVQIGDCNVAGQIGIQGINGASGIAFLKQNDTWGSSATRWSMTWDGTNMAASSTALFKNLNAQLLNGYYSSDLILLNKAAKQHALQWGYATQQQSTSAWTTNYLLLADISVWADQSTTTEKYAGFVGRIWTYRQYGSAEQMVGDVIAKAAKWGSGNDRNYTLNTNSTNFVPCIITYNNATWLAIRMSASHNGNVRLQGLMFGLNASPMTSVESLNGNVVELYTAPIGFFNSQSTNKLYTPRSLWGQSFDGSANVSGNMTGVGSISASGEFKTSSANAFRAVSGTYGFFIRNDGDNTYFLLTDSGNASGNWNSLRPLYINNATGNVNIAGGAIVAGHGSNVGIGKGASSYKLDVNGSQYINGSLTLAANNTICGGGGNLYIGNSGNNAYVYIQEDMQSSNSGAWSISTSGAASFSSLSTGSLSLTGNLSVGGTTTFSGAVTVNSTLDATGLIGAANGISVQNGAWIWGGLYAYNGASVSGNLTVSSYTNTNTLDVINGMTVGLGITAGSNIKTSADMECRDIYVSNDLFTTHSMCCYTSNGGLFITPGTSYYYARLYAATSPSGLNSSAIWLDINNNRSTTFYQSIISNGDVTALSDMRRKNVIRSFTLGLRDIASAPLFIHTWKDGRIEGEFVGTSAQYWQRVLPQAVRGDDELSMAYGKAAMAAAISLARNLTDTDDEVSRLKQSVSELQARIIMLEALVNN
ncbi:MAG: hypothetical protein NC311_09660 [Muribaculaceae bacterium]|nr:hypothetical protein [Muribaculaceae bacterium]